jgi:hypothetical protein
LFKATGVLLVVDVGWEALGGAVKDDEQQQTTLSMTGMLISKSAQTNRERKNNHGYELHGKDAELRWTTLSMPSNGISVDRKTGEASLSFHTFRGKNMDAGLYIRDKMVAFLSDGKGTKHTKHWGLTCIMIDCFDGSLLH